MYPNIHSGIEAAKELAQDGRTRSVWLAGPGVVLVDGYHAGDNRNSTCVAVVTPDGEVIE